MNGKCDKCKRNILLAYLQPVFFGTWKKPETEEKIYLCDRCFAEWSKLWVKNFSWNRIHNIPNCKKILVLWKQFFANTIKEEVQFT
jgi:hypothetical protein